jgi:Domain of unknown function (DUF5679)
MEAYCFNCRSKKELKEGKLVQMQNVSPAIKGICSECGGQVFRTGRGGTYISVRIPDPNCDQLNEKIGDETAGD